MITDPQIVRDAAKRIATAASHVAQQYQERLVEHESAITERLLGAVQEKMNGYRKKGILWRARSLHPGPGRKAEEKHYGADFFGVLDIKLRDYETNKGFMVQAKRAEPGKRFSRKEWGRLLLQCDKMLRITPAAFVFVYSRMAGIRVIPANSIVGCTDQVPLNLYNRGVQTFFEDHLKSFIGDRRLCAPTLEVLACLARGYDVPRGLHLAARDAVREDAPRHES